MQARTRFSFSRYSKRLALVSLVALTACGGGDGGSAAPVSTPTPVPVPAPAPAPTPAPVAPVTPTEPVKSNTSPVANAGLAQSLFVGALATLDGSKSTDADSDTLTYKWELSSKPAGSNAVLISATALKPTFTPDLAGEYIASLVVNDGKADSAASTTKVTASILNLAPVANAGPNQNVSTGAVVLLNGAGSTDGNGDAVTYAWTLSAPAGSTAALSGATTATPQFTADVVGSYTATLVVNDGALASVPATVTVAATVANVVPVANAGSAQLVRTTSLVTLTGAASTDANGDALTYLWSFTSIPAGSAATLSSTTAESPTFTPDVDGDYVAQLIVNDGQASSVPTTVAISALTNLVANGSFEQGLASWNFALASNATGTCSYNVDDAPGAETLTSIPGFAASAGGKVLLGSAAANSTGQHSCTIYQDVDIPSGATQVTLTFDSAVKPLQNGCISTAMFYGLYSNAQVPLYTSATVAGMRQNYCSATSQTSLMPITYTLPVTSVAGTRVRLAFVNGAIGNGSEVVGIDNVRLVWTR